MLLVTPWRPALFVLGSVGVAVGAVILFTAELRRERQPMAFALLAGIGVIDSATRMGFLLFLPFVLTQKGATLQTVGLAMTLIFAGGAAGKLACAFIGARIGAIPTVWLTEGLTSVG